MCHNEIKSARKRKNISYDDKVSCYVFNNTQENTLYYLLDKLEEKYKIVFDLYYFQEFKSSEISKILRISEPSVRKRLSRARDKIRKIMKEGEWY